jgi:hypothetical protein
VVEHLSGPELSPQKGKQNKTKTNKQKPHKGKWKRSVIMRRTSSHWKVLHPDTRHAYFVTRLGEWVLGMW